MKICSLLLGNNKPNPHSKWGNTPENAKNTPEPTPAGPFYLKFQGKSGRTTWLAGCWQEPASSPICFIGRGCEPKNQQLLNFCCTRRALVKAPLGRGEHGQRGGSGATKGRIAGPGGSLPKTRPSRAAHSRWKVHKRAQGVSPPKCEVLNRAQGVPSCSQKAWGDGRPFCLGQGGGKALSRSPKKPGWGNGKRKSPRVGAWRVSRSRRSGWPGPALWRSR